MPASPGGRACAWRSRSAPPTSPRDCRIPVSGAARSIALTGRKPPAFQHRNSYQEIPHAPLFAAVTKFSSPVESTGELPRLLRHAWRAALADTPRPTHLDFNGLPGRRHRARPDRRAAGDRDRGARGSRLHRPVADERDIERAAAILTGARRLAIVAGDGAAASQAGPEVLALAEALAAPVATTLGARGIIPTRHRLSAGVAGSYSAPPANRIVHGADLVLFVGCDTGDQVTLELDGAGDRHADRADRSRSAGDRAQLSEHGRCRRRPEGDPGAAQPGGRASGARSRLCRGSGADRRRLARRQWRR